MDKNLVCIVGPTAVGKTKICLNLALRLETEIISADSRQVYREMSIGTAKPSIEELKTIKHHFIDTHSIEEEFSAGIFEKECLELLAELYKIKNTLIMTGGSGLYIDAVLNGLSDIPEVADEIRQQLNLRLEVNGLPSILEELAVVDPEYYAVVDKANPHRVLRGLEIFQATGKKFSAYRTKKSLKRPFNVIKIGLERPRNELYERINHRVDTMVTDGLIEEVKSLNGFKHKQALQTVGYKEVFEYLDGDLTEEEAIDLVKRNSRRYAKRQLTWFKRDSEIKWFHPDAVEDIYAYIKSKIGD
jgi:tRNA dimethylallyltransferase